MSDDNYAGYGETLEALTQERDVLRAAVEGALRELGVPTSDYPTPVSNAYAILAAAL